MKNALRRENKKKNYYLLTELAVKLNRHNTLTYQKHKIPYDIYKYKKTFQFFPVYRSFRRFCLFTDRSRNVHKLHFGRNFWRKIFNLGLLAGYTKASW